MFESFSRWQWLDRLGTNHCSFEILFKILFIDPNGSTPEPYAYVSQLAFFAEAVHGRLTNVQYSCSLLNGQVHFINSVSFLRSEPNIVRLTGEPLDQSERVTVDPFFSTGNVHTSPVFLARQKAPSFVRPIAGCLAQRSEA